MSSHKKRSDTTQDRRSIAAVASSSVEGYLKNASRRVRIPTAEGGRGTRRKLAMVTSAVDQQQQQETAEAESAVASDTHGDAVNVDDEWDEVDLPSVPIAVKKQEDVKAEAPVEKSDVKGESLPVALPEANPVKREHTEFQRLNDPAAPPTPSGGSQQSNAQQAGLLPGTRPPLIEQPAASSRSDTWRQRDPAYEAMIEQRDLLAAQRRSERIQRTSETATWFIALMLRGRLLWRQAHHPKLVRQILTLRRPSPLSPVTQKRRAEQENRFGERLVFYDAVQSAKELVKASQELSVRKLSLAPAWVTLTSDAVRNKTSEAVRVLLTALNDVFCLPGSTSAEGEDTKPDNAFTDWAVALAPHTLQNAVKQFASEAHSELDPDVVARQKVVLPHPLYFSLVFLTLASACGLQCRLVIAKQHVKTDPGAAGGADATTEATNDPQSGDAPTPLTKLSIFAGMSSGSAEPKKKNRGRAASGKGRQNGDSGETKSKLLPTSCFWVEVWSAERQCFVSVNPCDGCATLWGAPYTFSIGADVLVDATPRYTSKFSACYQYGRRMGSVQQYSFLWRDKLSWEDSREVTDILLESFQNKQLCELTKAQRQREHKQLASLRYSESVPTTLTALRKHPLFVIESELARHEGIYPKDSTTTAGSIKGHMVYKRSAVAILRSRDGWLREGRSLVTDDTEPYKTVPPPASRPFASPSQFFHISQTKTFEPLPLHDDGSIPLHGKTAWYIILDAVPPPGLAHLKQPQIVRVARRMQVPLGLAVTGFNRRKVEANRRGHWEAVIDGIIVRETDRAALCRAYEEWIQLVQEQEAARRRDRAFHWWLLLSQRVLTVHRLREQYMSGVARHGELPKM